MYNNFELGIKIENEEDIKGMEYHCLNYIEQLKEIFILLLIKEINILIKKCILIIITKIIFLAAIFIMLYFTGIQLC